MKERLIEITEAIKAKARREGCTCEPEIALTAKHEQISAVRVAHEDGCGHAKDGGPTLEALAHELRRRAGAA